jgi:hypothetical protein
MFIEFVRLIMILVLGKDDKGVLVTALSQLGWLTVFEYSLQQTMRQLRRHRFKAVLFVDDQTDEDSLEFVLNIRDYDATIPIILILPTETPDVSFNFPPHINHLHLIKAPHRQLKDQLDHIIGHGEH